MKSVSSLIACSDLTGYAKLTKLKSEAEIFQLLSGYYEFVGDTMQNSGG